MRSPAFMSPSLSVLPPAAAIYFIFPTPLATESQREKMSIRNRASIDERQPLLNVTNSNAMAETSNIVGWDSPEDPENPRNWSVRRKTTIVLVLTAITILS